MDSASQRFNLSFIETSFETARLELQPGAALFREGELNDFVFFIVSGSIKILKSNCLIGITQANEFVGITSYINESSTYTFSARAVEPCEILKIKKTDFKDLLLSNATFCKQIISILCERLKHTDQKTRNYFEQSPQNRLIHELLLNAQHSSNTIKAILTVEDLSELTGISKRTMKKLLKELSDQDLIAQTIPNTIELLDIKQLEYRLKRPKTASH